MEPPHALLFPFPLHSHINSLLQLGRILGSQGCLVTFVLPKKDLKRMAADPGIQFMGVTDPLSHDGEAVAGCKGVDGVLQITETMMQMRAPFEEMLESIMKGDAPVSYVVSDLLVVWMRPVAHKFKLPNAKFWPGSAAALLFNWRLPQISKHVHLPITADDMSRNKIPVHTKGILPLLLEDIPYTFHGPPPFPSYFEEIYTITLEAFKSDWFLVNTFEELEKDVLISFQTEVNNLFPIGPLLATQDTPSMYEKEAKECLDWLEDKADYSVLYVAFGTVAELSEREVDKLATELELSKQSFIWALGPNISKSLPKKTREKLREQGMVVEWAPQQQVLKHRTIGGFLTHCGWNSLLEGIGAGVPMLGWPFLYDQNLNCKYMVDEWGIGIKVGMGNERVEVGKIRHGMRKLLVEEEGKQMRERALALKKAALCRANGSSLDHLLNVFVKTHGKVLKST